MIVFIDITTLEQQRVNTGIQRVTKEFLQQAIKNNNIVFKILLYDKKIKKMQILQLHEVKLFLKDIKKFKFTKKETISIETYVPKQTTIWFDIDSTWNAPYKRQELYPILKNNGILIYNFIHDLIPIYKQEFVQEVVIENYKSFIKAVYKYSDTVLFNSNSSKNDFEKYQKELKIQTKIQKKVIYLGSNPQLSTPNSQPPTLNSQFSILNSPYILFVGTIEPRKNHQEVLDAFDILSKKYTQLNLVFIGMKGWNNKSFMTRIQSHPLRGTRFHWLQGINDDTLYHFYKNAFVVTYLSSYEGYGLPVVESLQHSNITITSNNSSMPEVGQDFADYIDDGNISQLVEIISKYYEDKKLYDDKKQYIKENFKSPTWKEFSDSIFDIFYNIKNHKLKQKIKSIPFIGSIAKWSYNLFKLNNLK